MASKQVNSDRNLTVIISISLSIIVIVFFLDPIPQDPAYHQFADQNTLSGIKNFWNVSSNIPFVIVGVLGLFSLAKKRSPGTLPEMQWLYLVLFAGIFLTGFGSSYYHLNPNNQTLVWDRLPMTLTFMSFFCIIIGEHISVKQALRLSWPLIIVGILTIFYWHYTESINEGDLRPYVLVQFLPVLLIPMILLMFDSRFTTTKYLWYMLLFYFISKLAEHFDAVIYDTVIVMSGHSIKHIVAAFGIYLFYLATKNRQLT